MSDNNKRPVFLDLTRIHMPVTAVLSFGHRVSGALLVLLIPLLAFLFDRSLASEQGYAFVGDLLQSLPFRLFLIIVIWALVHHLLAGIRFLLIDFDVGVDLDSARVTAWIVLAGGIASLALALLVVL